MTKKKLTKTDRKVLHKIFGKGFTIIYRPKEDEGTLTIVTPLARLRWPNPKNINYITKPAVDPAAETPAET